MSGRRTIARRLGALPRLARCRPADVRVLARRAERIDVAAGTVLVAQGRPVPGVFVVLDGTADVHRDGVLVGAIEPGSALGAALLGQGAPSPCTVTAHSHVRAVVLGARAFAAVRDELPDLALALYALETR